jgi:hypothetical protein
MDIGSLVSALISAKVGEAQMAVAAKILQMNAGQSAAVQLIDAAQANFDRLANVAAGIGTGLDTTI